MAHMSDISLQQLEGIAKDILALLPSLPPQHYDNIAPRLMQLRDEMQSITKNAAPEQTISDNDNDICKADDVHSLTSIKGIDDARADALRAMGYHSLAQIAALQSDQIAAISHKLNLADEINQQNWIEQAALLLSGAQTSYAQAKEKGQIISHLAPMPPYRKQNEALPIPKRKTANHASGANNNTDAKSESENAQDLAAAPPTESTVTPIAEPRQDQEDQLTYIKTISPACAAALKLHGITRFADIANWRAEDIERISSILNIGDQIQRENWIEQAAILTQGGETHYAYLASLQAETVSKPDTPSEQRVVEPPDQPDPPPTLPEDEASVIETHEPLTGEVETGEVGTSENDREQDIYPATDSTPHPATDAMSAAAAAIAAVSGAEQNEQENSYPQHEADARHGTRPSAEQIPSAAIDTALAIDAANAVEGKGEVEVEPELEAKPSSERAATPHQSPAQSPIQSNGQQRAADNQTKPAQSPDTYGDEPQIETPPPESPPHDQASTSAQTEYISSAHEPQRFVPRTTLSDLESLEPTPIPQPQQDHAASAAASSGQTKGGFPSFHSFQKNDTLSHAAQETLSNQADKPTRKKSHGFVQRFLPRFLLRVTKPERKKS